MEIVHDEGVDRDLVTRIRIWFNQILEKTEPSSVPSYLSVKIWRDTEGLRAFYQREKEDLGVDTGEEIDFLATHEAWRGYPRIHICQEKLKNTPKAVVQGVVHHEFSHALHHGSREFYTFRYSKELQEMGHSCGLNLALLQQCVYFLSVALKDTDVVNWLTKIGFGCGQVALIGYLIADTEEERQAWAVAEHSPALRKIMMAALLKILLPIEGMISMKLKEAQGLREKWNEAYGWLPEHLREGLFQFAHCTSEYVGKTFQERLEHVTLDLLRQSFEVSSGKRVSKNDHLACLSSL